MFDVSPTDMGTTHLQTYNAVWTVTSPKLASGHELHPTISGETDQKSPHAVTHATHRGKEFICILRNIWRLGILEDDDRMGVSPALKRALCTEELREGA